MTYFEAALAVLKASNRPMTAQEIMDEAIARGLVSPGGKTPATTLASKFYVHVRDAERPLIERCFSQGRTKAERGSVRWRLRTYP
jgi:HB1, ASXL, restriction endonuclease HTH domain